MASQQMEIIAKVLEQSAKLVEEQVDAQISKLNEMDDDDFERLKERRLEALRKAQKQKEVWSRTFRDIFVVNGWTKKSSATILQEMYFFFLCWKPFSNYLTMFPKSLYTCDRICCVFFLLTLVTIVFAGVVIQRPWRVQRNCKWERLFQRGEGYPQCCLPLLQKHYL